MTLPVNVSTATVTGTFLSAADGTPAVGTVTLQPVPLMLDASADVVLLGVPVVATLDVAGHFTVDVVATDDPDLNPVNWCYAVTVRLSAPVAGWRFAMNALAGTTVDVSDAMPIDDPTTGEAVVVGGSPGPAGPGVAEGGTAGQVLTKLSATDFDTAWQTPVGGGGSGITDGDKGDIVVSSSGTVWMFDDTVVTTTARSLLNDATTAGMRTTLGLGSVDNTADSAKPISTAQQAGLDLKADKATTITPVAPLTGGGSLAANRTLSVVTFDSDDSGVVPASGGGTTNFLRADGTWAAPPGGGGGINGITVSEAGTPLDTDITTLDFLAGFDLTETPENEVNVSLDLTEYTGGALPIAGGGTGATVAFAGSSPGVVPTSVGGTANFLRADGSWAQPPSGFDGTGGHASFVFNATTTAAPAATQIRMNNASQTAATTLWVSEEDFNGLDVTIGLAKILAGHQIYIQDYDDASRWVKYDVTAAVDSGAYFTFTIVYHSGPVGLPTGSGAAGRVELQGIAPGSVGVPPGGTTGQSLTKTTNADYAVQWSTIAGGSGINGIVVKEDGGTALPGDFTTLNFANGLDLTGSAPSATITVDLSEYSGSALPQASVSGLVTDLSNKQPLDVDLTTIASLVATTDNVLQSVSGLWASRTPAQLKTTLALVKGDVGLGNVDNTSDANKPVSTAEQTALDLKQDKSQTINAQTGTSYTLVLADASKIITLSNASAITLTVPTNASVAFPVGTSIDLIQLVAGQFTVTGAGPPTISKAMATAKSRAQYSVMTLIKTATDVWILTGDAAAS